MLQLLFLNWTATLHGSVSLSVYWRHLWALIYPKSMSMEACHIQGCLVISQSSDWALDRLQFHPLFLKKPLTVYWAHRFDLWCLGVWLTLIAVGTSWVCATSTAASLCFAWRRCLQNANERTSVRTQHRLIRMISSQGMSNIWTTAKYGSIYNTLNPIEQQL